MLNLMRAEWLKLTRRPLTLILLAIFLALLVLQFAGQVFIATVGAGILAAAQVDEYRQRLAFPGIFGAVFSHINGLGGIFAVILAAGALGSEYSWGTLRTHLARYPARSAFLLAKIAVVLLLLLISMLITLVVGVIGGWLLGSLAGGAGRPTAADLFALPVALLRALYVLLPYVLLTLCFTVLGRSLLVGLAGGMLYLVFEAGLGAFATFAELGGVWQTIYDLTIGQNINTLVLLNSHAFGLRPETVTAAFDPARLPSPLQATLLIALYSLGFLTTALFVLERRDVTGPV